MFSVLLFGFSCGIPLALVKSTLQAWMAAEKVDITTIGLFSLVSFPYSWKFIWAPFLDRYFPKALGRRRSWMLIFQVLLVFGIAAMAFIQPAQSPLVMAAIATTVAFFSASQDIVVDAFRTEALTRDEYGAGSGVYVMGYRIAMLTSGALALFMADHMSWQTVYLVMAATMGVGILGTLTAKEPEGAKPPKSLKDAVVLPLLEFVARPGAFEVLAFITLYKLDVAMAMALNTAFVLEIGFSKTDIAAVTKGFGLVATIVGTLVGGALMPKLGMRKSLWIFGILQGITSLLFCWLEIVVHQGGMNLGGLISNYSALVISIAGENLTGGMGTAVYAAFFMSLCNKNYTATQYALLTSLMAFTRDVMTAPSGYLQKAVGWQNYFVISALLMIPGLLLLLRYSKWRLEGEASWVSKFPKLHQILSDHRVPTVVESSGSAT